MSGVIEDISHDSSSTQHDDALHNLLGQHSDNPEAFLGTVFAFLQRESKLLSQPNPQRKVANILQSATGIAAPSSSSTGVKSGFFGKSVRIWYPCQNTSKQVTTMKASALMLCQERQANPVGVCPVDIFLSTVCQWYRAQWPSYHRPGSSRMHAYRICISKNTFNDSLMVMQSSQAKTPGSSSNATKAADPAAEPAAGTAASRQYSPLAADASKHASDNTADAAAEPAAGSAVSGGYSSAVSDVTQEAAAASKASAADDGAAGGAQPMDTATGTSDKKADEDDDDADESKGLSKCSCF